MQYFVTGATGFIGKRLVKALLARRGSSVHFLLREASLPKLAELHAYWGLRGKARLRAQPVLGDITAKGLGVAAEAVAAIKGRIDHVFHLAAVYDLQADAESQQAANVEGTRNLVAFARAIAAGHVHHVSSIAAAGLYEGVFREDMFEQARGLQHPYFKTKHDSERVVRRECRQPWTIYRPALVVGDSTTGEMDKIDGPYYFFKLIQRLRQTLPPWLPMVGIEGGRINVVPVDFVVKAIDHIAHGVRGSGGCYHLVDGQGHRVGDVLKLFARAAHAPPMSVFINTSLLRHVPDSVQQGLLAVAPLARVRDAVLKDLGIPQQVLPLLNYPTRFDRSRTDAALAGSGIECPPLESYAWRLWDYWERHLDPALHVDRSLKGAVAGRVVLVTGGSSGIGLAAACRFAEAGATTIICARDEAKLAEALDTITRYAQERGTPQPRLHAYAADIADAESCTALVARLTERHGGVDVLINNAGRSIRRAIENSYERQHDFERTMQLNYFGALRLTMGLLPGMVAKGAGHVVNISSISVLVNAPRFSAYVASKAALDAWTRCASSEFADQGVSFTTVHMPLVRTPMTAPTRIYERLPLLSPEEAAEMIVQACINKPARISTKLGVLGELLHTLVPRVTQVLMNAAFRLFPESAAAQGKVSDKMGKAPLAPEAMALAKMLRGVHF